MGPDKHLKIALYGGSHLYGLEVHFVVRPDPESTP